MDSRSRHEQIWMCQKNIERYSEMLADGPDEHQWVLLNELLANEKEALRQLQS